MDLNNLEYRILSSIFTPKSKSVALHILKGKSSISNVIKKNIPSHESIKILNLTSRPKENIENLEFYKKIEDIKLDKHTVSLIIFENTIFNIKNLHQGLLNIKKYTTSGLKILVLEKYSKVFKKISINSKEKKISNIMFTSGFRLKNRFVLDSGIVFWVFEVE